MSGTYLTWLADELRAAGLTVTEVDGWQTRARSSGGYADPAGPLCVMWHHTADSSPPANQVAYIINADTAPISNIAVDPDGVIWLIAAGATNTNGKGGPQRFSRGTVPTDRMNEFALGVELMNNGVGQPYPRQQIDAAFTVSNVVNARCRNQPEDVCTHAVWSPGRKIDPATAAAVQGPWRPRGYSSADTWNLDDLRTECRRRATAPPVPPTPPQPTPEGLIDMYLVGVLGPNSNPANPTPTVIRVGASTVTWEANATAQGIDEWFGVPIKNAGDPDVATLLASRSPTNALSDACSDPASPYYCPALAAAWT